MGTGMLAKIPTQAAFFMPDLRTGGAERAMSQLAAGFAENGIVTDFVLVKAKGSFLAQVPSQVRIVDLDSSTAYHSLLPLISYLRRAQPQVVISALDLTNLIALFARQLTGLPERLVIRLDNTLSLLERNIVKKRLEKSLVSRCYPWADEMIAVSRAVADDFADYTGISPARICTIYNPVILPTLAEQKKITPDHPWFLPGQPPVVLGVGRLTHQKNFELLIRAFQRVKDQISARLVILGEGEMRSSLEALAAELSLQESIDLPGNVTNPYAFMAKSAVFVLSSRYEGLPTVLVEAMACACPVVSTDCPSGPREILNGEEYGHLVPPENPEMLATAILDVLQGNGRAVPSEWLAQFELEPVLQQYLKITKLGDRKI
jgi:glycosyltransferase involved in cell wall biosynthesis